MARRHTRLSDSLATLGLAGLGLLAVASPRCVQAAAPRAYVTDLSDTVTIVDTATDSVVGTIAPPMAAGFVGVAVSPDGSRLYVADGNHSIAVVTSPDNDPRFARILLDDSLTPIGLALTPDGSHLYVSNAGSNTVSVIDTATHAVTSIDIQCNRNGVDTCSSLPPIAVTPGASAGSISVYVGTLDGFAVIDTSTDMVTGMVGTTCGPEPCGPLGIAASSDGRTVFVSLFEIDQVLAIVPAMDLVDGIAMVGLSPVGLAVTPDAKRVYIANMNGGSVSVVDVASCGPLCTVSTIPSGLVSRPNLIAVSPDGATVYVGGNAAALSVIDTARNAVTATVSDLHGAPVGIAIGPGDSDGDGLPDAVEGSGDTDGDGRRDSRDTDSDADTITDAREAGPDPEHPVDTDSDGTPDYRDTDSDDDGIPDRREAAASGSNGGCAVTPASAPLRPCLCLLSHWPCSRSPAAAASAVAKARRTGEPRTRARHGRPPNSPLKNAFRPPFDGLRACPEPVEGWARPFSTGC